MLIDKHNLSQEKIKLVSVVHPSGQKFMSLILDLILIAIKEVMRRKTINASISLDISKAKEMAKTMNQIESDLRNSLQSEMKVIREKTHEIQEIINRIYPRDENIESFDEFIKSWHEFDLRRMSTIRENQAKIAGIYKKVQLLQEKAEKILTDKKYDMIQPSPNELRDFSEFYEHIAAAPISDDANELNIVALLLCLQSMLPKILNYIENFSYDEAEVSADEMKIVQQKLVELEKFDPLINRMLEREKTLHEKIAKLRTEKEEQDLLMNEDVIQNTMDDNDKMIRDTEEQDALRVLLSPKYSFDASKNCVNHVTITRKHLAFAESDDSNDRSFRMNQSKFLRPFGSDTQLNKTRKDELMPPPKQTLPSRRKRRDAMQILEQATSKKFDLNSTKYTGAIPKSSSGPLSSTLLSSDLINHGNPNFSTISSIAFTPIPHLKACSKNIRHMDVDKHKSFQQFAKPDFLTRNGLEQTIENIPWHEIKRMDKLQGSPATKSDPLEDFGDFRAEIEANYNHMASSSPPKICLNDQTLGDERTVCEKENFGSELISDNETIVFKTQFGDDENLFNVSDSLLVDD